MNFAFSEEQDEFRELLRRFVEERWPVAETRRLAETDAGFDRAVWKQMADELGLQGLAVSEAHGGQGFGMLELGIALEELGRQLAGGPFLASAVLSNFALSNGATPEEHAEFLPGIAAGTSISAWADAPGLAVDNGRASGRVAWCIDAHNADLLLLTTRGGLIALDPGADGVSVVAAEATDLTRKYAHIELAGAPVRKLGVGLDPDAAAVKTRHQAVIAVAAEQVGAAAHCFDQAVAYVKERLQFGRPVGGFQAVKHRAADAYAVVELARSAAYWSWWVAANDGAELGEAAHVVKSIASEAARTAAYENIHLHGGYGFTWEHDAHLYYRRAAANELFQGDPVAHRAALAAELGVLVAG